MDELRVVRREDQALIVSNDAGEEFRLPVDHTVLSELRHFQRQSQSATAARIKPREIQALIRAGKSHAEIIALTGAEESDIERYEEPVLAERAFILQNAHAVPVRTSPDDEHDQQFGAVIAERLIGLEAQHIVWSAWRDPEAGWMVGLEFDARDVHHRAIWSFEHRKGVLAPITPDAESLSRQGEVGDRLIPKLRAVETSGDKDRFDSGAFERTVALPDAHTEPESAGDAAQDEDAAIGDDTLPGPFSPAAEAAYRVGHPSTGSIPVVQTKDEFARRREIDQRAINTPEPELPELGQTADLLDALRRRRGARQDPEPKASNRDVSPSQPLPLQDVTEITAPTNVTPLDDDSAETGHILQFRDTHPASPVPPSSTADRSPESPAQDSDAAPRDTKRTKGRTSIPSWDDILFGTRSEEDPV